MKQFFDWSVKTLAYWVASFMREVELAHHRVINNERLQREGTQNKKPTPRDRAIDAFMAENPQHPNPTLTVSHIK